MALTTPEINTLATKPEHIESTAKCMHYLQKLTNQLNDKSSATQLLAHIAAVIRKETNQPAAGIQHTPVVVNQVVLNLSFRCYYQLVHQQDLEDSHFGNLETQLTHKNEIGFLMMHAVLLTQHAQHLNAQQLERKCIEALLAGVAENSNSLLAILKTLNLLIKKQPTLTANGVLLPHFYQCVQNGEIGMREEALTLFQHCCKDAQRAFGFFETLVTNLPWTNRNKYYLLSGILNTHNLSDFLAKVKASSVEFYAGLRMSLSYKSLLAASQYLVKSLSNQDAAELLQLALDILTNGTLAELQNFYAQWFARIQQQDALFSFLQAQPQIVMLLADNTTTLSRLEQYRFIVIFCMFAKQLFALSKLHFFKISTELLTNVYCYELDAQLLIYRFLVASLSNFAIEDCLDFLYNFMAHHRAVQSAQFRNTLLGKLPTIINHISKHYCKGTNQMPQVANSTLEGSIKLYFVQLQQLIERDIRSEEYQPQIYALKMFEILHNSLYAVQVTKNAKNCSMSQNKQLGAYLRAQNIYDAQAMSKDLMSLLANPHGFDDARDLAVQLLRQMHCLDKTESQQLCQDYCMRANVDECALATLHAQLAVATHQIEDDTLKFCEATLTALQSKTMLFKKDPLLATKQGGQLFGYLNVINECLRARTGNFFPRIAALLVLLEDVLEMVLNMLNLANQRAGRACDAASFQDMDESLQLLVAESAYVEPVTIEPATELAAAHCKYLLMSFWLTLKATCDLATTVGCLLLQNDATVIHDAKELKQCLYINVAVLTRCRHKGAIEAAGLSVGRLTKGITQSAERYPERLEMLHNCLATELLLGTKQVSTTRRGAGFAIMFLHIVKNDEPRERPILQRAMSLILQLLQTEVPTKAANNHDCLAALTLHYLCVLAKDTELRSAMFGYYNDVLLAAIANIDNAEWTVCNAALQLFGALVPKLVGQRQCTEFEAPPAWEPSELTYSELTCMLPQTCEHILNYCAENTSTRSIILFMGFLAKVEHLQVAQLAKDTPLLQRFRALSWQLLSHHCEQVRKLAAICFVRAHAFSKELPAALLVIAQLLGTVQVENYYQGLLFALQAGVQKLQHETEHVWTTAQLADFMRDLGALLVLDESTKHLTHYTLTKLLDLLMLLRPYGAVEMTGITQLVKLHASKSDQVLGLAMWRTRLRDLDII